MNRSALRAALYGLGGLSIAGAVVLALLGCGPAALGLAGWALVLVVGLMIERWRYKPLAEHSPGLDWTAFALAFKGVLLEGLEVAFIVVTFGAGANQLGPAVIGGVGAVALVGGIGAAALGGGRVRYRTQTRWR